MSIKLQAILGLTLSLIGCSTVFFHFVEKWSWVDAYFFTVITISTVGYGNLVPATVLGKIATTVLIFLGIGILAAALEHFGTAWVNKRADNIARKRNHEN